MLESKNEIVEVLFLRLTQRLILYELLKCLAERLLALEGNKYLVVGSGKSVAVKRHGIADNVSHDSTVYGRATLKGSAIPA
ncbi:MAG: hypothetical protein IH901_01205 [Proteobacteria bacterium]|nr:hypothetical protein [Pseudomonadota bacterium]